MRVLHLNNEKTWRGGERQTLFLAAELPNHGVESVVGCRPASLLEKKVAERGLPTIPIGAGNLPAIIQVARASRQFDLIHCHTARGHSVAALSNLVSPKPVVVTRRVDFEPSRSAFNRFKYRQARKVVCISEFIARQLRDWGVPAERLAVVPSAIPTNSPFGVPPLGGSEARAELRKLLNISGDKTIVGNIAALVGHKDHATLLRAARHVASRRPDVVFVVIGEGELHEQLLSLRRELGLESVVHFAGFIPDAERLLPAFDVFVMSSCMEGLGSVVLDAFAAKIPVAATAGGGLPELVRDKQTGLLAAVGNDKALADKILQLLDDHALGEQLVEIAARFVSENYSVTAMAQRYLSIYKAVLA